MSTYVFDLDGVIYLGDTPFPDSASTLRALADAGHKVYFLTNNSGRTRSDYRRKLSSMGISVSDDQIMTSAYATALYLSQQGAKGKYAFVIGESGVVSELESVGINAVTQTNTHPFTQIDFVVVGIDRLFSYQKLLFAHAAITQGHAQFIATNRDATVPMELGEVPGCGSLVAAVACATSTEPILIGKPKPYSLNEILKLAGSDAAQSYLVGDRLDTDIAAGNQAGVATILVLTGIATEAMARQATGDQKPSRIIGHLAQLLEENQSCCNCTRS